MPKIQERSWGQVRTSFLWPVRNVSGSGMGVSKVEGWYKASIRISSKAELSSYFPLALCSFFDACQSSLTLLKVELALLLLSGRLMPVNMQQSSTEAIYVRVAQCCTPFPVRMQVLLRGKKMEKAKGQDWISTCRCFEGSVVNSWGWCSWGTFSFFFFFFAVEVVELMCGELQWRNRGACGKKQNVSSKLSPPVK